MDKIERISESYKLLQEQICVKLEEADGKGKFTHDPWNNEIGSGITAVMDEGAVIEKGAVNLSFVRGLFTPKWKPFLEKRPKHMPQQAFPPSCILKTHTCPSSI
jgi:coproporphyrinogen III oxidase